MPYDTLRKARGPQTVVVHGQLWQPPPQVTYAPSEPVSLGLENSFGPNSENAFFFYLCTVLDNKYKEIIYCGLIQLGGGGACVGCCFER